MKTPEVLAESLFQHIKHGDATHQEWLRKAALEWCVAELTPKCPRCGNTLGDCIYSGCYEMVGGPPYPR